MRFMDKLQQKLFIHAEKEFMGLMAFAGNQPTLKETVIAKNYLNEKDSGESEAEENGSDEEKEEE